MVPDRDASLSPAARLPRAPAPDPPAATVAVVRSDNRRGAVAEALALLDAEARPNLAGPVVVLPVLGRGRADSADPGALAALLDAVLSAGAGPVTIASGHPDASRRFDRLGYLRECWGRPVRFLDLGRDEADWEPIRVAGGATLRLSRTVLEAGCRVALTPIAALARGPAFLLAPREAAHPDDRPADHDGVPSQHAGPLLSVVEGPVDRRGRTAVAVAGTDSRAVDDTAARLLGVGRRGPDAAARITVVGDAVGPIRPGSRRPGPGPGPRADPAPGDRGRAS